MWNRNEKMPMPNLVRFRRVSCHRRVYCIISNQILFLTESLEWREKNSRKGNVIRALSLRYMSVSWIRENHFVLLHSDGHNVPRWQRRSMQVFFLGDSNIFDRTAAPHSSSQLSLKQKRGEIYYCAHMYNCKVHIHSVHCVQVQYILVRVCIAYSP